MSHTNIAGKGFPAGEAAWMGHIAAGLPYWRDFMETHVAKEETR